MFPASGVLGHSLTEAAELPVSPLVAAVAAALLVAAAAYAWRADAREGVSVRAPESWAGTLPVAAAAARAGSLALLALVVVAGRIGPASQVRNLAAAAIVGLAWPLLTLASAAGPAWRWVDPWDAAARGIERVAGTPSEASPARPGGVHAAGVVAPVLVWYLVALPPALEPGTIALAAGIYSIAAVGLAVALGRAEALGRGEPVGILLAWTSRARSAFAGWTPPPGAEILTGASLGALAFGLVRLSTLWGGRPGAAGIPASTLGLAVSAIAGATAVRLAARAGRGPVVSASVPAVAGLALALALARARPFTALRVVVVAASDPFGLGWNLFGTAGWPVTEWRPGSVTVALLQSTAVVAGAAWGTWVAARCGARGRGRDAAAVLLAASAGVGVAAATAV